MVYKILISLKKKLTVINNSFFQLFKNLILFELDFPLNNIGFNHWVTHKNKHQVLHNFLYPTSICAFKPLAITIAYVGSFFDSTQVQVETRILGPMLFV